MTAEPVDSGPDPHTTAGKLADLERRYEEAVHAGSARGVEKQHAKGKMTARERVHALLDDGSFIELDELARHRSTAFGLETNRPFGDGVVTGYGTVDGRPIVVFSQDVTVFGGALGEVYGEKIVKVLDFAMKTGCPVVGINEGGGARTHNTKSGNAHYLASDETDAINYVKALLSYLPSNNLDPLPVYDTAVSTETDESDAFLDTFIPDSTNTPYDMHEIIAHLLDDGEFLEVHELFAQNMLVGFGRIEGYPVGVVANQPTHFAGCLDIDASEKAARFVRTCDAFNVPILTLVDVPGFLPGVGQEHAGIIRRGAKLIYAYCEATVPKVTVITRKAFGGAYDVMGSKHLGADINVAWPTAQIAVMGAQGAVSILHRKALAKASDPEELRASLVQEYEDMLLTPYLAAERGYIDSVIPPSETRAYVIKALRMLRNKRQSLPPKKHGNIPL
jgi:acetyl-CoA carboxylase carboxyltransferase component